jgi:hypothetical protein
MPSLGKVSLSHGDASPEMVCSVVAKVGGTCTDACHQILSERLRCALPVHMGGDTTCVTFSCDVATMPSYGTSTMDAAISISGIVTTPGRTTPFAGASRTPSFARSADATVVIGSALTDDAKGALVSALPASGTVLADSWWAADA